MTTEQRENKIMEEQVLRNQIKVDEANLSKDINNNYYKGRQEAFEKESERIVAKKKKLLEMEYPMCVSTRKDDYSEDCPLGGMIEPYDIEREKELVREYEKK